MRVFIYEYICGGGLAGRPLPESLAREGWAMLASIVEDFARVEGCEVVTTLDERLAERRLATRFVERLGGDAESERRTIERLAADCDWTLLIAPESDGILFNRVRWVEESGGRLLGPSSAVVAIAADKLVCGQMLGQAGVPAVSGRIVCLVDGLLDDCNFPAVLKPRDGAGSQSTFLVPNAAAASRVLREAAAEGLTGDGLLQAFLPGRPASVSFLVGAAGACPLLAGEQLLSDDGRFRYRGGRLPLPPPAATRAVTLAAHAVAAVPRLAGFVGVDIVLGDDAADDCVIELNPRLTTSYVGVRRLARANLAERMLRVAAGQEIEPISWRAGTVSFSADGRVAYSEADPGNSCR